MVPRRCFTSTAPAALSQRRGVTSCPGSKEWAHNVADGGVAAEALLVHLGQHRHPYVDVVDYPHGALAIVEPVKTPSILLYGAAPRDGKCEKERVQPGVIEAFADIPPGSE